MKKIMNEKEYKAKIKTKSIDALEYTIKDASESIATYPTNLNCAFYLKEIEYCTEELNGRELIDAETVTGWKMADAKKNLNKAIEKRDEVIGLLLSAHFTNVKELSYEQLHKAMLFSNIHAGVNKYKNELKKEEHLYFSALRNANIKTSIPA